MRGIPTVDRSLLRGAERWGVPLLDQINTRRRLKELEGKTNQRLSAALVYVLLGRRYAIEGLDPLRRMRPSHGTVLVSNHRTLFDMYIGTSILMRSARGIIRRMYFPVRASYWYDTKVGVLANLVITGGAMWPPIYRDDRRFRCNPIGLEQMAAVLGPGAMIGMHPEGKRKTDADAWTQLTAKRGVGSLLQGCDPRTMVLPFFLAGVGNHLPSEVRANIFEPQRWPIRVRFGSPMPAGELVDGRSATQVAEAVMERIHALGLEDRARYGERTFENPSLAR